MSTAAGTQGKTLQILYSGEHILDPVALFIGILVMANFCFCVRFSRDTAFAPVSGQLGTDFCRPISLVGNKPSHPVSRYQFGSRLNIVNFASGDQEINWKAKFVAQKMKLRSQSSSTFSYMPIRVAAGHAGSGAMNLKVGGIDHCKAFFIHSFSKNTEDFFKDSRLAPTLEPGINRSPFPIKFRQLSPRSPIFDDPENAADDKAVANSLARFLLWQMSANPVKKLFVDKGCFHFLSLIGRFKLLAGKHPFSINSL